MLNPQLTARGELKHLLSIEGLPPYLLPHILDTAANFIENSTGDVKTLPLLHGKRVGNLFCADSTSIRTNFETAARHLSAELIDATHAAEAPSEPLLDTVDRLVAMPIDLLVVRHALSGAPHLIAEHLRRTGRDTVSVVNAGDGCHADPTQALLDMYTIRHYKRDFANLIVAIVGDIAHSRIARSDIHALNSLGVAEVRAVGPQTLLPAGIEKLGVRVCNDHASGLRDCDVVIVLRLPDERTHGPLLPSAHEYHACYGLTPKRLALARPDAIVMHAEPLRHGVEIDRAVANGPQTVPQPGFGSAVCMAVLSLPSAASGSTGHTA